MSELTRRPALWLAVAAVLVAGVFVIVLDQARSDSGPRADPPPVPDLGAELRRFAAGLHDEAPYRPPSRDERRLLLSTLDALRSGDAERATADAGSIGFTVRTGVDPDTARPFALAVNPAGERAWGWYLIDLSAPIRLAIEVPHPNSDLHTEHIGLAVYRRIPGAILAVAGAHRRVAGGAGDVAHRTDSMFHAVAGDLADRGVPQLQLHGFHDDTLPDTDIVISPGPADPGPAIRRLADELIGTELRTCRSWRDDCTGLEGTRNDQARDAAAKETPFIHLEINRTIRDDPTAWPRLTSAIEAADLTGH